MAATAYQSVATYFVSQLRCIYISQFRTRFHIKLACFDKKRFFFITKHASLVQNRPRNRAIVNTPLVSRSVGRLSSQSVSQMVICSVGQLVIMLVKSIS
jgi:hypothetical protein